MTDVSGKMTMAAVAPASERWTRAGALTAVAGFILAVLEMVAMSGPFAAYFYGVYSPFLQLLQRSDHTLWLPQFWAVHTVPSAWIDVLDVLGITLAVIGLSLFVVHAVYLYAVKFRRDGVAARLLYRHVRHPQYTSLMVAGLGFAVLWPRFINLVLFIAMCIAYEVLARSEERRMQRSHGDAYRASMRAKPMFFPGAPGAWLETSLLGWLRAPRMRVFVRILLLSTIALCAALAVRATSIRTLLDVTTVPGAEQARVVSYRATASPALLEALAAKANGDVQRVPPGGPAMPQLFYLVANRFVLEHFLIDAGVRHADGVGRGDAPNQRYVVHTRLVQADGRPARSAAEASSLRVRRVLHGVYAIRSTAGGVTLVDVPNLGAATYAHSNVPLL